MFEVLRETASDMIRSRAKELVFVLTLSDVLEVSTVIVLLLLLMFIVS